MSSQASAETPANTSQLVESIREVQKMQAQVRSELSALEAKERQGPGAPTGLPTGKCIGWTQTTECKADGPVQSQDNKSCTTPLSNDWSGYCECGTSDKPIRIGFDCQSGQQGKTCAEICEQTGASAYGPLPATDMADCIQGGGAWMGQGGQGFAAGNPGAFFPGCPAGSTCCAPLTGTINTSDAGEIVVSGATGNLSRFNGDYTVKGSEGGAPSFASSSGLTISFSTTSGWNIGGQVSATGPHAKNPQQIPVGGPAEPWQSNTGESADASGIRLSAVSKTDEAQDAKQKAELTGKLQELEQIETTLLDDLRTQRLAGADAASATSLALRAEGKAASMIVAESEEQRRRLARQRGQAATDTTMITAARSMSMRAQAYTKVTLVAIAVLVLSFIIYKVGKNGFLNGNMVFILSVAIGGAALIIMTIMMNNIKSRNPRNYALLYFDPPAGSAANATTSSPTSDNGNLRSCRRALRAARNV